MAQRAVSRRPGSVEETDACFIVRDASGPKLAAHRGQHLPDLLKR
jgi:hypothetical protein